MSGYLPTCQQTKGERQRVPQSSDSRTLKPQPATPNPYGDHGFSARFRQFSRVWGRFLVTAQVGLGLSSARRRAIRVSRIFHERAE